MVVEYKGELYDEGFEFDTVKEQVAGIMWQCMTYSDMKNISPEEIQELDEIWEKIRPIGDNYSLMEDIGKLLETQDYLNKLREELNERFGGRDASV